MQRKEHIKFYPETHFNGHNFSMASQKKTASFAITRLPEVITNAWYGCVRLPNFDLLIISLSVGQIFVKGLYLFTTDPYALAIRGVNILGWKHLMAFTPSDIALFTIPHRSPFPNFPLYTSWSSA